MTQPGGRDVTSAARELLERSWVANAEAWTRAVRENRIASRRQGTDSAIVEAVAATNPANALDVGCGEGWLARALAGRGIDVVGVDASPPLIERARELGGARFAVLSYDELAEKGDCLSDPFDAIVCNFSLFDDNLEPVLSALARRLAPHGTLFIQTAHPANAVAGLLSGGWRTETFDSFGVQFPASMPWYCHTLSSWHDQLHNAGMRVVEAREPAHSDTGEPLSLLLVCRLAQG